MRELCLRRNREASPAGQERGSYHDVEFRRSIKAIGDSKVREWIVR